MEKLLLHSLFVSPVINWITSPSRVWSRKRGINIAIFVLIVIAVLQMKRMDTNCFEVVGVDRFATSGEMAKAYRKQTILHHPDQSSSSGDKFIELQKCYEIISNPHKLSLYNRFGELSSSNLSNESIVFPVMAIFSFIGYVVHFIVCAGLTSSPETRQSMYWVVSFLLFAFSSEMFLLFLGETELFGKHLPWLIFEQVEILKGLIPSVLSSGLLLGRILYSNDRDMIDSITVAVHHSNRQLAAHIVHQRAASIAEDPSPTAPLIPAVLNIGKTQTTSNQAKQTVATPPAKPGLFQRIMGWLFLAVLAHSAYKFVVSMI